MANQDFIIAIRTTADTAGIKEMRAELERFGVQVESIKKASTKTPTPPTPPTPGISDIETESYKLARRLNLLITSAVIAGGYKFVSELRSAASEIQKISVELDKQGAQLVTNAQKFAEQAKFATTTTDVIKTGEGALKGVEAAHKNLLDIAGKELTTWEKIKDIWVAGFKDKGPIAKALELQQAHAAQNYEMERANAIHEITSAQRTKDDLAAKSYTEKVEYLTEKIAEQERAQRRAGVSNVEDWLKAGAAAENYRKILQSIKSAGDKSKPPPTPVEQAATKAAEDKAAEQKKKHIAEVKKYGRVLSPQERVSEDLRKAEEDRQKAFQKADADRAKLAEEQQTAAQRGITIEQLRNEREYLGPPEMVPFEDKANIKTSERIAREARERIDAEANQRAGRMKPESEPTKEGPPPEARPSPAPTPSPDVVKAIDTLRQSFDRAWT